MTVTQRRIESWIAAFVGIGFCLMLIGYWGDSKTVTWTGAGLWLIAFVLDDTIRAAKWLYRKLREKTL